MQTGKRKFRAEINEDLMKSLVSMRPIKFKSKLDKLDNNRLKQETMIELSKRKTVVTGRGNDLVAHREHFPSTQKAPTVPQLKFDETDKSENWLKVEEQLKEEKKLRSRPRDQIYKEEKERIGKDVGVALQWSYAAKNCKRGSDKIHPIKRLAPDDKFDDEVITHKADDTDSCVVTRKNQSSAFMKQFFGAASKIAHEEIKQTDPHSFSKRIKLSLGLTGDSDEIVL